MQNQAAVEALYSATFVEDYLDCVENLPNDLQRHLSRLREFDLTQYSEFLRDLDTLVEAFENEKTAAGQRQVLAKIQLGLIAAQDIGDDKLSTVQALTDIIEDKTRLLKHDAEILNFNNDDNDTNQPASSTAAAAGNTASKSSQPQTKTAKKPNEDRNERSAAAAKRRKKASAEKGKDRGGAADLVDDEGSSSASRVKSGGQGGGQRSSSAGGSGKKMAKRRRDAVKKENKDDSDQDLDPNNANDYDPDEPTYCLCEQVSFGEMVCCDNDLCPYEWFHFECVHLTHKPKGKWFCPRCRGDKVSVMKPKSQFLKELDRFNKEKEAKMLLKQIKR